MIGTMKSGAPRSFGAQLRALRVAAGFTQEELATIAGLSVHAVSALERGERRRPHVDTVRALVAALDLTGPARDALALSARASADDTAVTELTTASLPIALTELVGRDADVHTVRQWLRDPGARLITLVGPGGVGKTRLALALAHSVADGGSRVVFVELAAVHDPAFVALAIAEAMGLSDVTAVDLPRRVQAATDQRAPTLLVLDNCEQVLDAAPLVADLLSSAPTLRLLTTSREPFRVRGERLYTVGPLALQPDAETMPPAESRPRPRRATVPRTGSRRRAGVSADRRECRRGDRHLSQARCPAAGSRAGRAVDQGAQRRGAARPARTRRAARVGRSTGPARASADDERDRCVELSAARSSRTAGVPPAGCSARPVSDRGRRGGARRDRFFSEPRRRTGLDGQPDRQEFAASSRTCGSLAAPLPDARSGARVRSRRARRRWRT